MRYEYETMGCRVHELSHTITRAALEGYRLFYINETTKDEESDYLVIFERKIEE